MLGERASAIPNGNQNKNGQPDAVINLGRYVSPQGELSTSDINRLNNVLGRVKQGVDCIITSGEGAAASIDPGFAEARKGRHHLITSGVPASFVHSEPHSHHTWENAIFTRKLVEGHLLWLGLRIIEVNTSAWHDRAWDIFDHTYGDDYEIRFNGVHDPPSPHDLEAEISGRAIADQIIKNTPRGNLKAIEKYVAEVIPLPSGILLPLAA
jgi:uncharacterized SAM-binding protein YcdF (DUF218 family)